MQQGHSGWVTSIATHPDNPNLMLSSSRDKTVLVWNLTGGEDYGYVSLIPMRCFLAACCVLGCCYCWLAGGLID